MQITVDILGERQLNRRLGLIVDQSADLRPAFDDVRKNWIKNNRAQFRSEGAHGGGNKWQKLSPKYRQWKARHYPGKTILRRTDRLWHSLTVPTHPDFIYRTALQSLLIGTKVPYAIYHQKGAGAVPVRKVVELTEEQKRQWPQYIQDHIFKSGIAVERVLL